MPHESWENIKAKSLLLVHLCDKSEWEQLVIKGVELEEELKYFFEEVAPSLSVEEQSLVKEEGAQVVGQIADIVAYSKLEKSKITHQAGKVLKGKKGISAYKNS